MQNVITPIIGEIYMIRFEGSGSEQSGWRPGLIIQNNIGNLFSPNVIALPLTSSLKKTEQPTHVVLPSSIGLKLDSMVLCENPERVSKMRLGNYITRVPDEYMSRIAEAYILATAIISFLDFASLHDLWEKTVALNASPVYSYCE